MLAVVACEPRSPSASPNLSQHAAVVEESLVVKTGPVGAGRWATTATFVLADVRNSGDLDLLVTVGGALVDGDGKVLGDLRAESLRIPAGGVRTFALVDVEQGVHATAATAQLGIRGAVAPNYPPPVTITDGHIYQDRDRAVVAANATNTADRPVKVLVIAGFYDDKGRLMKRPFSLLEIDGGGVHPVRFVGPDGSRQAYIFVGELTY